MDYKDGCLLRANEAVYGVVRSALPEDTRWEVGRDPQGEVDAIVDVCAWLDPGNRWLSYS